MLTRTGWLMLVAAAALYVGGWALGFTELIVLASACVIALIVAIAWVLFPIELDVKREIQPVRVTRGDLAMGLVTVTNRGSRPSPALVADDSFGEESVVVDLPRLAPGATRTTTYRLPTRRRAEVRVGPLTITRNDPLGLLKVGQSYGSVETLWVHPVTFLVRPLPASRLRDLEGPTSDAAPQGTITFHRLREYVPGDDRRHIHWRSSARTGRLMVRHHVDTSQPHMTVVLDTRRAAYHDPDEFERAVESAASLVVASTTHSFPVELYTTEGLLFAGDGNRSDTSRALDRLAAVELSDVGSFAEASARIARSRGGSALVVVAGRLMREDAAAVASVQRRFNTTVLVDTIGDATGSMPVAPTLVPAVSGLEFAQAWNRLAPR